jgi:hypothetical protein
MLALGQFKPEIAVNRLDILLSVGKLRRRIIIMQRNC